MLIACPNEWRKKSPAVLCRRGMRIVLISNDYF